MSQARLFFGNQNNRSPDWERWELDRPRWKQVHGTRIALVTRPGQDCGECDGLVTFTPGLPLGVVTADCIPILLQEKSGPGVAALHAGWRGVRAQIVTAFSRILTEHGKVISDWRATLGPSIQACCFEVSEESAREFVQAFAQAYSLTETQIQPRHRHLDLHAIVAGELRSLGMAASDIERVSDCSKCARQGGAFIYRSYRREGPDSQARQVSAIASSCATL